LAKISFKEAARNSLEEEKKEKQYKPISIKPTIQHDVRSVQRIQIPQGKNASWVAQYYTTWLGHLASPLLHVKEDEEGNYKICMMFSNISLLELSYSHERSTQDRALYYITGGIFENAKRNERGRLEFRQIPGEHECIVAIHDYMPSLPWFVYKYTQAKVHLWVMYQFRKHLENCIQEGKTLEPKEFVREKIGPEAETVMK